MAHTPSESAGIGKATLRSYLTGFGLAILLTAFSFVLVMSRALTPAATIAGIFAAAVVQMLVHLHYFLHLDRSSEERWNVMAMLFTVIVIVVLAGGSIWILFNMSDRNMIPLTPPSAVTRPVR